MVYMLFSRWHFPSLGSRIPPSFPISCEVEAGVGGKYE
uniref:Uncharacterized protein n=1 Tax=Anguilla anguilla TaxID=7936 RepID=A0A0E9U5L2_ANGAN